MPNTAADIMTRLKTTTREDHERAEHHDFQKDLAGAKLSQADYIRYLEQMLLVHRALDGHLEAMQTRVPLEAAIRIHELQTPYLESDLKYFGRSLADINPLECTRELVQKINQNATSNPFRLLGYHYVLEGSNNGSKFIALSIRRKWGLRTEGVRYLDPYGDEQPTRWQEFKSGMNSLNLSESQANEIVEGAREMFAAIYRLSGELQMPTESHHEQPEIAGEIPAMSKCPYSGHSTHGK